jgi:hypothetical protein
MRRLHHGCGESLQCDLLDIVRMHKPRWQKKLEEGEHDSPEPKRGRFRQKQGILG